MPTEYLYPFRFFQILLLSFFKVVQKPKNRVAENVLVKSCFDSNVLVKSCCAFATVANCQNKYRIGRLAIAYLSILPIAA